MGQTVEDGPAEAHTKLALPRVNCNVTLRMREGERPRMACVEIDLMVVSCAPLRAPTEL